MHTDEREGEWIEWDGGECPVPGDTLVQTRFRDGAKSFALPADFYCGVQPDDFDFWKHEGTEPGDNIIAYRVVQS